MKKKFGLLILALAVAVSGAASYVWFGPKLPGKYKEGPKKISFGVDRSVISAPVWVAEHQGYFQKEGLEVIITDYSSGRTALVDMLEKGKLDLVTVAQTPVMYNSFTRNDYAIIAAMACSYEDVLLLARADKGIKSAMDLKGKKIGTPIGSSGHFFLGLFLIHNGMRINDVNVVDVDAPDLPRTLAEGRVDAIAIWQPHIDKAQELLNGKALLLPSRNIYREDFYLVPRKEFIKNNPEALKKFLKAIDQAENFIQLNREAAIKIVSGRLQLDRKTVNSFWVGYEFRLFLDQTVLTDLEAEARWAIKHQYTTANKIPDYFDFLYLEPLKALRPEAVNIIR